MLRSHNKEVTIKYVGTVWWYRTGTMLYRTDIKTYCLCSHHYKAVGFFIRKIKGNNMICVSVYNSKTDVFSDEICACSVDFYFESIEEMNDLLDICLSQGKSVVISIDNKKSE